MHNTVKVKPALITPVQTIETFVSFKAMRKYAVFAISDMRQAHKIKGYHFLRLGPAS
jgi:hypothetical protein